jgi:uncharacterized tellurite resistance protein B-like protein
MDSIRSFFARAMKPNGLTENGVHVPAGTASEDETRRRLHVAACALLLELAHADDEFTEAERFHIEAVVQRHLGVDSDTARTLLDLADQERKSAVDLYQFTSLIRSSYDLGQKTLLAEIMWGVILADGEIERHEGHLLRKIANLLDLQPGYRTGEKNGRIPVQNVPDPAHNPVARRPRGVRQLLRGADGRRHHRLCRGAAAGRCRTSLRQDG